MCGQQCKRRRPAYQQPSGGACQQLLLLASWLACRKIAPPLPCRPPRLALPCSDLRICCCRLTLCVQCCRGIEGEGAAALQQLLLDSVQQQQPEAVRTAALQVCMAGWPWKYMAASSSACSLNLAFETQPGQILAISSVCFAFAHLPAAEPAFCPSPPPQWAIKLFPFGHIPARHLCILAAGDPRFQIAEGAAEGLQPSKFASGTGGATGSAKRAGSPDYPPFGSVLEYLQQQAPALGRRPAEGAALALPAKVR